MKKERTLTINEALDVLNTRGFSISYTELRKIAIDRKDLAFQPTGTGGIWRIKQTKLDELIKEWS